MMMRQIFVVLAICIASVVGKQLTELKYDIANLDTDRVDCKSNLDIIDECGLQQGYSHRFKEFAYPTNHTFLMASCKRQADALKCLRAYSKCLQPLSKQVLIAMINSRQRFNKKVCSEKPSEAATKLIEHNQCFANNKQTSEKGFQSEVVSVTVPESIVNSKIDSLQERLKQSCCSVARVRKEYLESGSPQCKQYAQITAEIIDSYLSDTVGIICPEFNDKSRAECEKLPKLTVSKPQAKFFVRPILNVIQTLA